MKNTRDFACSKVKVVYYTVALSTDVSPLGLWDSLNRFTVFTQPPYLFAACLVSVDLIPWGSPKHPRNVTTIS